MALFLLKKRRETRLEETNMNRNTLAALSLTASLSLTLAACGSGGGTAQSPAPAASTPPAASGAPSGGVEDGVLTVGMECAYAPYNWTQMDDSNGAVPVSNVPGAYANGYDVMIAQRICDANGWELEVVSTAWDSLIPALQSGTIDVGVIDYVMADASVGEGTSYSDLQIVEGIEFAKEEYGIGFRQGSDLTAAVNQAMQELIDDGTLNELAVKYELADLLLANQ